MIEEFVLNALKDLQDLNVINLREETQGVQERDVHYSMENVTKALDALHRLLGGKQLTYKRKEKVKERNTWQARQYNQDMEKAMKKQKVYGIGVGP